MTNKPIRRYEAFTRPVADWCAASDLATLEAENERLRRVEQAADVLRDAAWNHAQHLRANCDLKLNIQGDTIHAQIAAYDAAKSDAKGTPE